MLSRKQGAIGMVLGSVALLVALGGSLGFLSGAGTESFGVQVATYFPHSAFVDGDVRDVEPEWNTATLIVAVNSPTGPHTGLLRDNFVVTAYCPHSDDEFYTYRHPEQVGFENLGGGFYRIDVIPFFEWWPMQYVFMVTAKSGRGSGVGVGELQTQLTLLDEIYDNTKD